MDDTETQEGPYVYVVPVEAHEDEYMDITVQKAENDNWASAPEKSRGRCCLIAVLAAGVILMLLIGCAAIGLVMYERHIGRGDGDDSKEVHFLKGSSSTAPPVLETTAYLQEECGGTFTADTEGSISSPNYPHNYGDNVVCEWTLTAAEGYNVALLFEHFQVEFCYGCVCDKIQIRDGGPGASRLWTGCNEVRREFGVTSTGSTLTVIFTSDTIFSMSGFHATYYQTLPDETVVPSPPDVQFPIGTTAAPTTNCGFEVDARVNGTLTSPGYPEPYRDFLRCIWTLTADPGHVVWMTFTLVDVEHCGSICCDELEVIDGLIDGLTLSKGCGLVEEPITVVSTGRQFTLLMHTDVAVQKQGFHLYYGQVETGTIMNNSTSV